MIAIHALDGTEVVVDPNAVTLVAGPYPHDLGPPYICTWRRARSAGDDRGCGGAGGPAGRRAALGAAHTPRGAGGLVRKTRRTRARAADADRTAAWGSGEGGNSRRRASPGVSENVQTATRILTLSVTNV